VSETDDLCKCAFCRGWVRRSYAYESDGKLFCSEDCFADYEIENEDSEND
jgi:hypothetical protein